MANYDGNPSDFDHLISDPRSFDLGGYFSKGWEIFKQNFWGFSGFFILAAIMSGIISSILGQLPMGFGTNATTIIFGQLLSQIASAAIGGAITAGFFIVARKISHKESYEFSDFFGGFQDIVQLGLAQFTIAMMAMIPVLIFVGIFFASNWEIFFNAPTNPEGFIEEIVSIAEQHGASMIGMGFLMVTIIYIVTAIYSFAIPLIVFERLSFWNAMEVSRKIITPKLGMFFVLYLLMIPVMFVGILVFFIGIIPAVAYMYCVLYATYEGQVGNSEDSMLDRIEEIGSDEDILDDFRPD